MIIHHDPLGKDEKSEFMTPWTEIISCNDLLAPGDHNDPPLDRNEQDRN